ncbi:MAG: hypothetical protein SGCHY_000439 [Lobulomycetales sp.]
MDEDKEQEDDDEEIRQGRAKEFGGASRSAFTELYEDSDEDRSTDTEEDHDDSGNYQGLRGGKADIPRSLKEAYKSTEWTRAVQAEVDTMIGNGWSQEAKANEPGPQDITLPIIVSTSARTAMFHSVLL